jgi:predicted DNA binding CopG/RHH family protein
MLHLMQQAAAAPRSKNTPDFAALLASLSESAKKSEPAWNDDDLADDVATLSYERALRAHARYKAAGDAGSPLVQSDDSAAASVEQTPAPQPANIARRGRESAQRSTSNVRVHAESSLESAHVEDRKSASITIRLSKTECEQLRARAAEAGLTVSAYLRSCTFEAEALRAQVKQALAELRNANAADLMPQGSPRTSWIHRMFRRKVQSA